MMENRDIITKHIQTYLFYQNVDLKRIKMEKRCHNILENLIKNH